MEATTVELIEETPVRWRIDPRGAMRVPGIVFASRALLPEVVEDRSMEQVVNIATLPGIVVASYAMPDVHWGYGFPIGGVAATDVEAGGVVSPGGVGFDISCGVRLLASGLHQADVPECLPKLMDALAARIPRGLGRGAVRSLRNDTELAQVLRGGARWAVEHGIGDARDLERCEDRGGVRPGGWPGHGDDPLRFPRAGPSDLLRLRAGDACHDEPLPDPGAGPAAGLRAGRLPRGTVLPGSDGRGRQLRPRQPPPARRRRPRGVRRRDRHSAPGPGL